MEYAQPMVPKEEPVFDCDEHSANSSGLFSGERNFQILTKFKDEFSSGEFQSSQGQFNEIEAVRESLISP